MIVVSVKFSVTPNPTVAPAGMLPKLQLTKAAVTHVPWLGVAANTEAALGVKLSAIITCETVELPRFVTVIWYPALEFGGKAFGPLIVTRRLATPGVGGACGVIAFEGAEAGLSPVELTA